ncbi:MAG: right-handed parallel beta-helix repeat-containing protein [Pseudonocardia sp.]
MGGAERSLVSIERYPDIPGLTGRPRRSECSQRYGPIGCRDAAASIGHTRQRRPMSNRRRLPWLGVGLLVAVAFVVYLAAGSGDSTIFPGPGAPASPGGSPDAGQPEALTNCTATATDGPSMEGAVAAARPGDRICLDGNLAGTKLKITRSGTAEQPITILGGGRATTGRITIEADNVVVDGVRLEQPEAAGFLVVGNGITVRNSAVLSPRGGDGDGIRFFGNDIKILNNVIRDTVGQDEKHADAIQTFATSDKYTPSQRVTISGNRFEDIDNICIIAEGPESEAGDGTGEGDSNTFIITDNFCENRAGQAFFFDDIGGVTLTGNEIVGSIAKAFSFQNDSVGARISNNRVGSGVGYEVGMDDSSEEGYEGPEPGGGP